MEFFYSMNFVWLLIIIIALAVEAATVSLASIWFSIGAVVAWISSFFIKSVPIQIGIFLIVSLVLLYFTRPVAIKYLKVGKERTNANSLIGKKAIVIMSIDPMKNEGQVKVGGQIWSAKTTDHDKVSKNSEVIIKGIEGVKLIVEKIAEEE